MEVESPPENNTTLQVNPYTIEGIPVFAFPYDNN